jgi:hypothetical protein
MEKEALEYAVKLSKPEIMGIGGYTYIDKSVLIVNTPNVKTIGVSTLSSLVAIIKAEMGLCDGPLVVHIDDYNYVTVRSAVCEEDRGRETPYTAEAELPNIHFDHYLDVESAIIQLKSKFKPTPDRDTLIALIGNLPELCVRHCTDMNDLNNTIAV